MVAVVLVLAFRVFAWTPDRLGQAPDGDAPSTGVPTAAARRVPALPGRLLWRDRAFLTLASGMALGLFAQIGLVAHLFSVLVPALGPGGAGAAMGLATGCAIAGRTVVGRLMPVDADRRRIACASYAVQVAGSLVGLAAGGDAVLLLAGVVLFGCGLGNATSLPPLVAQVEFTREDALRVVPLIVAIGQGTYAFAPAAFGLVRETLADPAMFALAALVQVAAIGCFLAGRR